ncbi:hypothetical protein ACHAXN_007189 [Cyclotella atomus]
MASSTPTVSFFGHTPLTPTQSISTSSFLAGDESISIIPSFSHPNPLGLISGTVGPFRAGMDTSVPLWLAVMLRKRKLARIIPPHWMDVEVLKEVLRFERDPREANFSPLLPFRHAEISQSILMACKAGGGDCEIVDGDKIKLLLEDIATVRMDKIRKNVHTLSSQLLSRSSRVQPIIDVTNIGSLEMHAVKSFVVESFRMHRELSGTGSAYSDRNVQDGSQQGAVGGVEAAGRGRLRASRLVRQEEEMEVPRPLEEIEAEEEEDEEMEEDDGGRSRLRRHR